MVLVCLSDDGHYQVEDDGGHLLLAPFYSGRDAQALATNIARCHRTHVAVVCRFLADDDDASAEQTSRHACEMP
jgi:hypothetical protein